MKKIKPLKKLRCITATDCNMITKQDCKEWENKARQKNLNIPFDFSFEQHPSGATRNLFGSGYMVLHEKVVPVHYI